MIDLRNHALLTVAYDTMLRRAKGYDMAVDRTSAATVLLPEWLERSGIRDGRAAPLTRARSRIVYKNPDSPRSSAAC